MIKFCNFCNKDIEYKINNSFAAHRRNCKFNPNSQKIKNKISKIRTHPLIKYTLNCKKCSNAYSLFLTKSHFEKGDHRKHCSRKCANSKPQTELSKEKISKKLRKARQIKIICKQCSKMFIALEYKHRLFCSQKCSHKYRGLDPEYRKKISLAVTGKTGGFRDFNGKNSGHYKGIQFQSSWELAFIVYHLEHDIKFTRSIDWFIYFYNNKKARYYPDFIKDGSYIEIKAFHSEKTDAKVFYFPKNKDLIILYKEEMQVYLNYCINKYGKDFVKKLTGKKQPEGFKEDFFEDFCANNVNS